MVTKLTLMLVIALAISGCTSHGSVRLASNQNYCPVGTVMVCSGLYGVEDEITPKCGCTELAGAR